MINIDNIWKFVTEELSSGEKFSARKEAWIEIIDRLRQSEKDAARYRWLRDEARYHMDGGPLVFMTNYDGDPVAYQDCGMVLYDSYLDSAIEEAMSDSKA